MRLKETLAMLRFFSHHRDALLAGQPDGAR
jgi:hypothetical protein